MSEHWDAYVRNLDDQIATLIIDLGVYETAPDKKRPCLLKITLKLLNPNEEGFYDETEADIVDEIEDQLAELLEGQQDAVYVCRITVQGRQEFYFYVPGEGSLAGVVSKFNEKFKDYPLTCEFSQDPDWKIYLEELFPTPIEMQLMQNYHIVTHLETEGDKLDEPRLVIHFAYFPSEGIRDQFLESVQSQGFMFADWLTSEEPGSETPYGVSFERLDPVDIFSINELTVQLFELAQDHEGDYDGWETEMRK